MEGVVQLSDIDVSRGDTLAAVERVVRQRASSSMGRDRIMDALRAAILGIDQLRQRQLVLVLVNCVLAAVVASWIHITRLGATLAASATMRLLANTVV